MSPRRFIPVSARGVALKVLLDVRKGGAFAGDLLDELFQHEPLPSADRRLVTHLVLGVIRRQASLDALLRPYIQRSLPKVESWLIEALRLGVYQLALLEHIPPHAALHETVELAAEYGRPGAKKFLNGVLRRVAEIVTNDRLDKPAAIALPLHDNIYRRLAKPLLPDPTTKSAEYLAVAFSWPSWLAQRWLAHHGWSDCLHLGFWFAGPAPLWLRVNPLKIERSFLQTQLQAANIRCEPGTHPQSLRLMDFAPVRSLPGFAEGWFTVQDESAMRPASALAPTPGMHVLDLCAAPGGKSTHLAELMRNQGRVLACDTEAERLASLPVQTQRLGLTIIETQVLTGDPPPGPYDAVLVDVPCSNTGVLGRRPEVRWRLQPRDIRHLVELQTRLLIQAAKRIRPGGCVVYSTCSIEPEENEQVVKAVRQTMPELRLEADELSFPGRPADGGYWARLRKVR